MRKMKLEDRISSRYVFLFFVLMLSSYIGVFSLLKYQRNQVINNEMAIKSKEIDEFFKKIEDYSEKYPSLTLEFTPILDGQKVVYSRPFNPGEEGFLYLMKIETSIGEINIPLNTVILNNDVSMDQNNQIVLRELEKYSIQSNTNTGGKTLNLVDSFTDNSVMMQVYKITREIKGNYFEVYVLKNLDAEFNIFKSLQILMLAFTVLGGVVIYIVSKYLSKRILKPVNNIIQLAETITTDDLGQRLEETETGDELEKLTKIINQMLNRLENSFNNQSKFVSDASHELRTPLAIIKGYAEIIKKHKLNNEEIFEESIDSIINEADNMKNLVQKLLFLAKGEMHKNNLNYKVQEVSEMIDHIYQDMKISMKHHNFVLETNRKYFIKYDETLLRQAIRALIENAVKYSKEGTTVYISSEQIGNSGIISIRDEGIGIKEEDKDRIFDRFYRVDDSRTKSTGGTGLGLAIVQRISELHGGKIKVESQYNVGTTMYIILPIYKK